MNTSTIYIRSVEFHSNRAESFYFEIKLGQCVFSVFLDTWLIKGKMGHVEVFQLMWLVHSRQRQRTNILICVFFMSLNCALSWQRRQWKSTACWSFCWEYVQNRVLMWMFRWRSCYSVYVFICHCVYRANGAGRTRGSANCYWSPHIEET